LRILNYQTRLWLLLTPYLLGIVVLVILPALLSFGLAFFRYDGLSPPVWAGGLNFVLAYTDELFVVSIQNSLALVIPATPLRVGGALLLALLLWRGGRGLWLFRAVAFLPSIIPSAAYVLAWLWIFNPLFGPLNILLRAVGLMPPNWLIDPLWAKPALILMSLWLIGEGFLVSLVALHDIPAEVEDAARVDGAGAWQRFWAIILPLIAPLLLILALRDVALMIQESFTAIVLITGGGPYYATYTLPLFVYEQGFDLLAFGTASVGLWVLYGLTGALVLALYAIAQQWGVRLADEHGLL
jgi:multiple sugar transport system permease protein